MTNALSLRSDDRCSPHCAWLMRRRTVCACAGEKQQVMTLDMVRVTEGTDDAQAHVPTDDHPLPSPSAVPRDDNYFRVSADQPMTTHSFLFDF